MAHDDEHTHGHSHGHGHHHHHHGAPCAHAVGRGERVPAALDEAEAACESRGLRLTPIRRQVLEALYANHRPASAYDLIDALATGGDKRHAPVTIYRALDFLLENGFVHRLESRNAFIACPFSHKPGEPVVFLICERCGSVGEIAAPTITQSLIDEARKTGFSPRMTVVEMTGTCANCSAG